MAAQFENHIIQFESKEETRAMKFLQSAVSKDPARAILTTIHVKNGRTVSADGFRAHLINTPEVLKEHEGKNLHPDTTISVTPRPEVFCEYEGNFPDLSFLEEEYQKNEPVFEIAINKNLIKDLASMPTENDMLVFSFTGEKHPIRVTSTEEDFQAVAYIMPMHRR